MSGQTVKTEWASERDWNVITDKLNQAIEEFAQMRHEMAALTGELRRKDRWIAKVKHAVRQRAE